MVTRACRTDHVGIRTGGRAPAGPAREDGPAHRGLTPRVDVACHSRAPARNRDRTAGDKIARQGESAGAVDRDRRTSGAAAACLVQRGDGWRIKKIVDARDAALWEQRAGKAV